MKAFPTFAKWIDKQIDNANENGFVMTRFGRKRRLPIFLEYDYDFEYISKKLKGKEVDLDTIEYYEDKLYKAKWNSKKKEIIEQAKKDGIKIKDNTYLKSEASRQVVNSIVQGTSAEMVKVAMLRIHGDKEFKKLGGKLLVPVHDELCFTSPKENAKRVGEIVSGHMTQTGADYFKVPFVCDVEILTRWNGEDIKDEVEKINKSNK